ncbi:unnamed protein product [Boreogadus saida]
MSTTVEPEICLEMIPRPLDQPHTTGRASRNRPDQRPAQLHLIPLLQLFHKSDKHEGYAANGLSGCSSFLLGYRKTEQPLTPGHRGAETRIHIGSALQGLNIKVLNMYSMHCAPVSGCSGSET